MSHDNEEPLSADIDLDSAVAEVCGVYSEDSGGAYEFTDPGDYVEGSTACMRGVDVLGAIIQKGSAMGARKQLQQGGVGFTPQTMKTGQKFLKISPKAIRQALSQRSPQNWKVVAQNALKIAQRLKNFDPGKHVAARKSGIIGVVLPGFINHLLTLHSQGGATTKTNVKLPTVTQLKAMGRALEKEANALSSAADKQASLLSRVKQDGQSSAARGKSKNHIRGIIGLSGSHRPRYHMLGDAAHPIDILGEMLDIDSAGDSALDSYQSGWADIVGDTASPPDPANPGWRLDGTPDTTDPVWFDGTPNPNYGTQDSGAAGGGTDWQSLLAQDAANVANLPGPDQNYGLPPRPSDYPSAIVFKKDPVYGDPSNLSLEESAYASGNYSTELAAFLAQGHQLSDWYAMPPQFSRTGDGSDGGAPADQKFYGSGDVGWINANRQQIGDPDPNESFNGGICYFTEHMPFMNFLSYTELFGAYPSGPPRYGAGSGLELHDDGWYGFYANQTAAGQKRLDGWHDVDPKTLTTESIARNWGPLMGRPDLAVLWVPSGDEGRSRGSGVPKAAGLRFDSNTGGMFWFWDQAPEDYKFAMKQVYIKQAQGDWDAAHAAAVTAYNQAVATLVQDQSDADAFNRQVTKDNTALQHQIDLQNQQNSQAEANAQSAAAQQQPAIDVQQAQLEQQLEQQQLQQAAQQQQLDFQERQAETAAYSNFLQSGGWQQGLQQPQDSDDGSGPYPDVFDDLNRQPQPDEWGDSGMDSSEQEFADANAPSDDDGF